MIAIIWGVLVLVAAWGMFVTFRHLATFSLPHLKDGLALAGPADLHDVALSLAAHPLSESTHGDFPGEDDRGRQGEKSTVASDEENEDGGDHQFVGDGVEEGSKVARDGPAPREEPIQPICEGREGEEGTARNVTPVGISTREIEEVHQCWNAEATSER